MPTLVRIPLGSREARALFVAYVIFLVLSTIAVIVFGELALRRWASPVSNSGMSALAAILWMYNLLPIIARKRSVLGGLGRALGWTLGFLALLAVATRLVSPG